MRIDSQLSFVPIGSPLSLIAAAGVAIPAPNVIDLLGFGVGVSPIGNSIYGNVVNFGTDMGVGGQRPELNVVIGTPPTTGTAATLTVALQAAADAGTPTWLPGAWQTISQSAAYTVAQMTTGAVIFRVPWTPVFPPGLEPRYLRLLFQVPAATLFTAGTIASALVTTVRDDQANKFAAKNFTVA